MSPVSVDSLIDSATTWLLKTVNSIGLPPAPETVLVCLVYIWRHSQRDPSLRHPVGFLSSWDSWRRDAALSWGAYFTVCLAGSWLTQVTKQVPRPYLDEIFHIPQAQAYCNGRFEVWDDKITTPPGLYFIAVPYTRLLKVAKMAACSVWDLRRMNLLGVFLIHDVASMCRAYIEARPGTGRSSSLPPTYYAYHTSVNIALFPVLFFFSALFYTDVYSAFFVLVAYQNHLARLANGKGIFGDIWTVLLGVITLLMRQTNVFWVVVYMGGLEAVHVVRCLKPAPVERPEFNTLVDVTKYYVWRYSVGDIHDPPLNVSWPDDWLFCGLSIALAALSNPAKVLKQIWPYITTLALFTSFVAWNGGVVLGDKSNHVATIHLAQMLYLWPLIAFFSAPILVPPTLSLVSGVYETVSMTISGQYETSAGEKATKPVPSRKPASLCIAEFFFCRIFYIFFILGVTVLAVGIVKYNTIIHPFTLADNRHYMFYVFRYTIRRSQAVRFGLIGGYMVSAHLVWRRLAGPPRATKREAVQYFNRPFASDLPDGTDLEITQSPQEKHTSPPPHAANTTTAPPKVIIGLDDPTSTSTMAPATSTALLWLVTTTLSLVTAPLVEPRYFILPWIFWRLLVPAWPTPAQLPTLLRRLPVVGWLCGVGRSIDLTTVLETVWFVVINAATFWAFLYRPYQWKTVDGELLDDGCWQRFMW